jgi:hypothetical protein
MCFNIRWALSLIYPAPYTTTTGSALDSPAP